MTPFSFPLFPPKMATTTTQKPMNMNSP
jgi:hypothetical protein